MRWEMSSGNNGGARGVFGSLPWHLTPYRALPTLA